MIAERFPGLKDLDPEDQLILAGELWSCATQGQDSMEDLSQGAVEALERRLDDYLKNPDSGVSWTDLKAKRDAGS